MGETTGCWPYSSGWESWGEYGCPGEVGLRLSKWTPCESESQRGETGRGGRSGSCGTLSTAAVLSRANGVTVGLIREA